MPRFDLPYATYDYEAASTATSGDTYIYFDLGSGIFELFSLGVYTDSGSPISTIFDFKWKDAHGDEQTIKIDAGQANYRNPFTLKRSRIIAGPGRVMVHGYRPAATTTFNAFIGYRRLGL